MLLFEALKGQQVSLFFLLTVNSLICDLSNILLNFVGSLKDEGDSKPSGLKVIRCKFSVSKVVIVTNVFSTCMIRAEML